MATLILDNDLTNAHYTPDSELARLVNDCRVTRVDGFEGFSVLYRCERDNGAEPPSVFHIIAQIHSEGYDRMTAAERRSRGGVR